MKATCNVRVWRLSVARVLGARAILMSFPWKQLPGPSERIVRTICSQETLTNKQKQAWIKTQGDSKNAWGTIEEFKQISPSKGCTWIPTPPPPSSLGDVFHLCLGESWRTALPEVCLRRTCQSQLERDGTSFHDKGQSSKTAGRHHTVWNGRLILDIKTTFPNIPSCAFYL